MNNIIKFESEGKESVNISLPEKPSEIAVNVLNSQIIVLFSSSWDAVKNMLSLKFEDKENRLAVEIKW
jgi:hypothetical protein